MRGGMVITCCSVRRKIRKYYQMRVYTATILALCSSTVFAFAPSRPAVLHVKASSSLSMVATNLNRPPSALDEPSSSTTSEQDSFFPDPTLNDEPPRLGQVRKLLPQDAFQVDTATSLFYFGLDFVAVAATMGFLNAVVTSDLYHSWPVLGQALAVAPLQVLTGFAMWCMWCIGHDAGHTTVSKDRKYGKTINRVVGEIAHSMICLTPFVPWQKSHLKHHMNHNHLERDYSHQWFIKEEKEDLHPLIKVSYETRNLQLPVLYLVYLLFGVPDGGHVFFYGRMWEQESVKAKLDAALSVVLSMATAGTLWMNMGTADFAVVCLAPWIVLSFWLFMVTYLQHHSDDGKLYTDDTWSFERGAFETVDRNYGKWINRMSHHMMDGHVVHHLFFTRVPHYRLEQATKSLTEGMEMRGQGHLLKKVETPDFSQEILKQFNENWFFVEEKQIVRE
jgi:omega-3 fatty acid desaturase (delta-15 desaturase)